MKTTDVDPPTSHGAIVSWLVGASVNAGNAWRNSRTRTMLGRIALEGSDARTIERIGLTLLAAGVTHATLLSMAPTYARPFYGVTGAAAMSVAAIGLIAMKHRLASAWASSALSRRLRAIITTPDGA